MLARTAMALLLAACRFFQQNMRNTLANVVVQMGVTATEKGELLSMIALGYFLTQVPGGALAKIMGTKNVITSAMLLSALCCLAMPTVNEQFGQSGLKFILFLMGAVQGPLFPVSSVFQSAWCPKSKPGEPDEKAWATSMLDVGISLGTLLNAPIIISITAAYGWEQAYRAIGLGSAAFVGIWVVLAAESPEDCWYISAEEKAFLKANISKPKPPSKASGAKAAADKSLFASIVGMPYAVATHPGVWAVFVAHMAFNFGAYYLTNWSPTYYKDVLELEPADAKFYLMMPHFTNLAVKSLNPVINGMLARNGLSLLSCRKAFTCSGFLLAGALLLPVTQFKSSVWATSIIFSLVNAAFGLAPSGFKASYLDITELHVGVISGYGNTLGTVATYIQPRLIGYILNTTKSWLHVLSLVALTNAAAALFFFFNAVDTPVEKDSATAAPKPAAKSKSPAPRASKSPARAKTPTKKFSPSAKKSPPAKSPARAAKSPARAAKSPARGKKKSA